MESFIDEADGVFLAPTISSRIEAMAEFFEIEPSRLISFLLRGLTNPHDTVYETNHSSKKALMIIRRRVHETTEPFNSLSFVKVDLTREFSQQLKIVIDSRVKWNAAAENEISGRAYCFYQQMQAWLKQEKKGVAK